MKGYSAERYESLFDVKPDGVNGADNVLRADEPGRYRCKTIKHGDQLDVEIFPIWNTRAEERKAKAAVTRKAQAALNDKNSHKRVVRLINCNFVKGDIKIDLTYDDNHLPSREKAYRDVTNYLRRVKRFRKKNGIEGEFKYVYSIEYSDVEGVEKRGHHHVLMSGVGMSRDDAEELWGKGRANADRAQPDDFGLAGFAIYFTKTGQRAKGKRRFGSSKNLTQPTVTVADTKISRRKASFLAHDAEAYGKDLFEHLYNGYLMNEIEVKTSAYVAGAYIYARMRRRR